MRKKAPILMYIRGSGLSVKITGILLGFFLVALAAIALTLFISWHLEGAAAAINDAGSLRMRVFRLAHLGLDAVVLLANLLVAHRVTARIVVEISADQHTLTSQFHLALDI